MNAPLCFQCFMDDHVFNQPNIIDHVVGYLDDANTYHSSFEEHVQTNQKLLTHCQAAHITLNPKKCDFHKPKIDFLGVELSKDGFEMEKVKIETVKEWKPPENVRGVREFIGFCNFY